MTRILQRLELLFRGWEPVKARDWFLFVLLPVIGWLAELVTSWDTATGWMGLGAGILVRLSTSPVRNRTTSMTKLKESGIDMAEVFERLQEANVSVDKTSY